MAESYRLISARWSDHAAFSRSSKSVEMMTRLLRWIGSITLCAFAIASFTPLANYISAQSGVPEMIAPADAIIVLGASVNPNGRLSSTSLFRAVKGITCFSRRLAPLLFLLGTATRSGNEAEARASLARTLGVPDFAIITEARAHTTQQEAQYSSQRLAPRGVRRILLVTDSQHLARAKPLFERFGFVVFPVPADDFANPAQKPQDRLILVRLCVREWLARLYYRMAGYI